MTVTNIKKRRDDFWAIAAIAFTLTGATTLVGSSPVQSMVIAPMYTVADGGHSEPSRHPEDEIQADGEHGGAAHFAEPYHQGAIAHTITITVPAPVESR
ncbi:MAG: hypothetical protein VKJ64_03455 [Leptolyngbyaceae bacterium]|nr:hypothetical protein [Leptolyngbyaceae bacterium]